MQGDIAPCGTTDRVANGAPADPCWQCFSQSFFEYFEYFVVSSPHAVFFRVVRVFRGLFSLAVLRAAPFSVFGVFCGFYLHMQCFFEYFVLVIYSAFFLTRAVFGVERLPHMRV